MNHAVARPLTTIDFLKVIAVVFMIVDHLGMYFFPGEMWWRVFGRFFGATWFFLIGYARTRDIPALLWGGAGFLLLANFIVGMPLFPLNALFVIILIRFTIDRVATFSFKGGEQLFLTLLVIMLTMPWASALLDNGLAVFLPALLGWAVRRRDQGHGLLQHPQFLKIFILILVPLAALTQWMIFVYTPWQFLITAVGLAGMMGAMAYVPMRAEYPELSARLPRLIVKALQWLGTHTLIIYVAHLFMFKICAVALGQPGYEWFAFKLFAW